MNKKVRSIFAGLVFAALALFLAVEGAEAFCVYNNTKNDNMGVRQTSGGNFNKPFIPSGGKECCNWQEKSCNKGGKRDSIVRFDVYERVAVRDKRGAETFRSICEDFPIKAGGWLTIEGSNNNYKCVAHE